MPVNRSKNFFSCPQKNVSKSFLRYVWLISISIIPATTLAQINTGTGVAAGNSIAQSAGTSGAFGTRGSSSRFRDDVSPKRGLVIAPRLEVGLIYTDNVSYSTNGKRSDFIIDINPGIRVTKDSGRLRGSFNYSLRSLNYIGSTLPNSLDNVLNAELALEVMPRYVYIDFGGSRARNVTSVFNVQPADTSRNIENTSEISSYFISPYLVGSVMGAASYELRYRKDILRSGQKLSNVNVDEWTAAVRQEGFTRRTNFEVSASANHADYLSSGDFSAYRWQTTANFLVNPQLLVFGLFGQEWNNYLSLAQQQYFDWGYGFRWRPATRLLLEAQQTKRFFGNGHRVTLERRTPRTAITYRDVRDVTFAVGVGASGVDPALFDLLFTQFASIEPDPARRTELVNTYLRTNGMSNGSLPNQAVQVNSPILRREQDFTFGLIGTRNSATVLAGQAESSRLGGFVPAAGDLSIASKVRQRRAGVSFSHALSQQSSLTASVIVQDTIGDGTAARSRLRTMSIGYGEQISPKLFFSAGITRSNSNGQPMSYQESTIYSRIILRF